MDELEIKNTEIIIQEDKCPEIVFSKVLKINSGSKNVDIRSVLNQLSQCISFADIHSKIEKGKEYIVQIPTEFQKGLDDGKYWIMENSETNAMWANLMERGTDGRIHIVTPLPIKKREMLLGNPAKELAGQYQTLHLQSQINELSVLMETTLDAVKRLEQGQKNDRVALLNAGRQGVILALSQKDEANRAQALLMATNNINIAQNEFSETLTSKISEFKPIPKSSIAQFLKALKDPDYLDRRDEEYSDIMDYYNLYLQSTKMLAGVYVALDDVENAKKVFDLSVSKIRSIDFSSLRTIEYAHKNGAFEKIYEHSEGYFLAERNACIIDAQQYDCLELTISGDELLEVTKDGAISEPKAE